MVSTTMRLLIILAIVACLSGSSFAQAKLVERGVKGPAGQDIQVGVFVNIRPDCSSGPLPAIRLVSPPAHGKIMIKRAKVNITNFRQCLALETPGFIAFYRSTPDFIGGDQLLLEVRSPAGPIEQQKITITVGPGLKGQGI